MRAWMRHLQGDAGPANHLILPRFGTCNGLLGHPLIIAGDAKHHLSRDRVVHLLCQDTRFFCTVTPVLDVIDYVRGHDKPLNSPRGNEVPQNGTPSGWASPPNSRLPKDYNRDE